MHDTESNTVSFCATDWSSCAASVVLSEPLRDDTATTPMDTKSVSHSAIVESGSWRVKLLACKHVTPLFTAGHVLLENDSIAVDMTDQDPRTSTIPVQQVPASARPVEAVRVKLAEDELLQKFVESLSAKWPSGPNDLDRYMYIADRIMDVLGGKPPFFSSFDATCAANVRDVMTESTLSFVSLGDMIGRLANCRYRALLFKLVCDYSTANPSKFSGKPVRCELRRNYLKTAHGGLVPHAFNVVHLDGVEHVIDLERSHEIMTTTAVAYQTALGLVVPLTPSSAMLHHAAVPFPRTTADEDLKKIANSFGFTKEAVFDSKSPAAVALPVVETPALRFAKKRSLQFHEPLEDGFVARLGAKEAIVFDSRRDPDLAGCIVFARHLMRIYTGTEKRAGVLAKYIAMKLGGARLDILTDHTESLLDKLRADHKTDIIPIGRLLVKSLGTMRHRALLYKYLADRTVAEPDQWLSVRAKGKEPVLCAIQMPEANAAGDLPTAAAVSVFVMVDSVLHYCDLASEMPHVAPARSDFPDIQKNSSQPAKAVSPTPMTAEAPEAGNVVAGPLELLRFLPSDLTDLVTESKRADCTIARGLLRGRKPVIVRQSAEGRLYDLDRLLTDVESLASAAHANVSSVAGLHYNLVSSDAYASEMWLLHDEPRGPLLTDVIKRSENPLSLDDRLQLCYMVAAGLSHLHSLGLGHGALTTAAVRVDESGPAVTCKLSGFELARYLVVPNAVPVPSPLLRPSAAAALLLKHTAPSAAALQAAAAVEAKRAEAVAQAAASASDISGLEATSYWAPERFADTLCLQPPMADIYSLGCIWAAILTGRQPWQGKDFAAIRTAVRAGHRPPFLEAVSSQGQAADLVRLIDQCTAASPKDRPSIDECLERMKGVLDYSRRMARTGPMALAPVGTDDHKGVGATASAAAGGEGKWAPIDRGAPAHTGVLGVGARDGAGVNAVGSDASGAAAVDPALVSPMCAGVAGPHKGSAVSSRISTYGAGIGTLPDYADGPSVEACDVARETAYSRYGCIDSKMLVGEQVATCALYIIHRSNGNVALASRGLADPPHSDPPTTTGLGIELWGEAAEAEVGTGKDLGASFLFQMIHEVAGNAKHMGLRLRQLLDVHGIVSMELNNVDAPPMYVDPNSGRTCVLLGVPAVDIPDSFYMPGGLGVRLVTVKLLTFEECLVVRRFAAHGRKALANVFAADGSRHISTVRHVVAPLRLTGAPPTAVPGAPPTAVPGAPPTAVPGAPPTAAAVPPLPAGPVNSLLLRRGPVALMVGPDHVSWNAERLRNKLIELKAPIPVANRPVDIDSTVPTGATSVGVIPVGRLLPPYDEKTFDSGDVVPSVLFPAFSKPNLLATAMSMFDMRLRVLSSASTPTAKAADISYAVGLAKHVINTMHTQTQIAGWVHFEEYILDADKYITRLTRRAKLPGGDPAATPPVFVPPSEAAQRPVGALQSTGELLVKRLLARVQWVAELQQRARQDFDPDLCLHVVVSDGEWMDESGRFMQEAEAKVTGLLKCNSARFGVFRDLQKRGVAWPHNAQLRRDIEAAGFAFRPMMVKRDRCVCDICGVEISGWRVINQIIAWCVRSPWFNPWHMHHLPRHTPEFAERVARCGPAFANSGLFAISSALMDPATAEAMSTAAAAAIAAATAAAATTRPRAARPIMATDALASPSAGVLSP